MRLFPRLIAEGSAEYGDATGKVRVLPPEVAHRIAAGEVIERPASAVKELVENALDAGATRVEVEIEGGGVTLLRVRDDGSGMSSNDAERAIGRHATSKISSAEDLARVISLGASGERRCTRSPRSPPWRLRPVRRERSVPHASGCSPAVLPNAQSLPIR
ncbi:MAG: DNA mismatch repair protein MutL [uncultured Rubrobacteraceae bacterium]|uniref:DNA mismatch repair protein MutL n=1 Tax=uncultured Rubrobacteraceae bacterium TaxID=349277 RepID=A0A6J4QW79_9ACTN|nr:MAG: DNA mismatch repair protein MutL [uncultured Rubrobacteraceae bacterium]